MQNSPCGTTPHFRERATDLWFLHPRHWGQGSGERSCGGMLVARALKSDVVPAAQLIQMWHTFNTVSAANPSAERRVRKHTSSVDAALQLKIDMAVKRALRDGGSDFRFPALSGAEAAALMQAAGIVNEKGKLAKKYR